MYVCEKERKTELVQNYKYVHLHLYKKRKKKQGQWDLRIRFQSVTLMNTERVQSFMIVSAVIGHVSVCEHGSVYICVYGLSMIGCLLQSASPQASV